MKTKGNHTNKWIETTIPLTLNLGKTKQLYLCRAQALILAFANNLLPFKTQVSSALNFHHLVYKRFKYLGIHSQVQEAVQRRVYAAKRARTFHQLPMEFNFPRSGNLTMSTRGNPIVEISPLKKRIALPISRDGGWRRVEKQMKGGWTAHSCKVFKHNRSWVMHLILRKALPPTQEVEGTIGVDVGRKIMAAITVNHPSFALVEQYLGKDLAWKQHQFQTRKAVLQQYAAQGDKRARRALIRLRKQEKHYVQTRCAQIAHEIVCLAALTRSAIIIEDLKYLRRLWTIQATKGNWGGKKIRRSLNRWSYSLFHDTLTRIAQLHQIPIVIVLSHYTSQTCSHCGKRSKRSRRTRDLFSCISCRFTVNADRNASRNLSLLGQLKLGLPFFNAWSSYLPVPCERRTLCSSVSLAEVCSTTSYGVMSSSVPVD